MSVVWIKDEYGDDRFVMSFESRRKADELARRLGEIFPVAVWVEEE